MYTLTKCYIPRTPIRSFLTRHTNTSSTGVKFRNRQIHLCILSILTNAMCCLLSVTALPVKLNKDTALQRIAFRNSERGLLSRSAQDRSSEVDCLSRKSKKVKIHM